MSVEVTGQGGSGATDVYMLPDGYVAILETLSFTLTTSASGNGHMVRVRLTSPTDEVIARLDDLNVGGDGQTNFYTFGLGLNGSACTLPAGLAVTDALPWTELPSGTTIEVTPIDSAGATIAGDTISGVLMHFDRGVQAVPQTAPLPLTLLPGSAIAA